MRFDDHYISGHAQVVAPVYLWLTLFSTRSWQVAPRRRGSNADPMSVWESSVLVGSSICGNCRDTLVFLESLSEGACLTIGCYLVVRWTLRQMFASGGELLQGLTVFVVSSFAEVNTSLWMFASQVDYLVAYALYRVEKFLHVWRHWYFGIVFPVCWSRFRKFCRQLTFSKVAALAAILVLSLTSPLVTSFAVANSFDVPQPLREAEFYEIPFGMRSDDLDCTNRGPVRVGKVHFAAFSHDSIVSAFRRTRGFSSCNCGCESNGLCSDFRRGSPDSAVQQSTAETQELVTAPDASRSPDLDNARNTPEPPGLGNSSGTSGSQDLAKLSESVGSDDHSVTVVQDSVETACLELPDTAFMFEGSHDPSYSDSYDASYGYDSSYPSGEYDYSSYDQSYAAYQYDASYGQWGKGKSKGVQKGMPVHYRDPSRGIDIHAGFSTKQAPVLLKGCTWRDARSILQKFFANARSIPKPCLWKFDSKFCSKLTISTLRGSIRHRPR